MEPKKGNKVAPLPSSFMLVSIVGFFFAIYGINDPTWAFTIALFCVLLFIASIISMTYADVKHIDRIDDIYNKKMYK